MAKSAYSVSCTVALWISLATFGYTSEPEGIYIAIGHGLHRMASNDGIHWTAHQFAADPGHDKNDLAQAAVGNNVCVAIGGYSRSNILTTRDGKDWTKIDFNAGVLSGIVYLDERFLAFGQSARVIESEDGYQWKRIGDGKAREHLAVEARRLNLETPIKSNIRAWRYANGRFVGSGDNGFLVTTSDLENWLFPPRIEPQSRLFIETDGENFVVFGHFTVHHSIDGLEWTDVTPQPIAGSEDRRQRLTSLSHDGSRFLLNNRQGLGWTSLDGRSWQLIPEARFPATIEAIRPDLIYSFETYWKATEDLRYSVDGGKSWQSATIPAPVGITDIVFAPGFEPLPQ